MDENRDDIPLQKQSCHEFCQRNRWKIVREFYEKGVSGFKVAAQKRDAIQDLKAAAEKQEFDILLVFMFDRIGRIDDETPFVVEWFASRGIEVWSVKEGEQRFDSHVDS
jgi:DNA invertase Pin-like site-specific DNA recombinase